MPACVFHGHLSGEQVLYLNRRSILEMIAASEDHGTVRLRAARLEVRLGHPTPATVRALTGLWYRDRATAYLRRRSFALCERAAWVDQPLPCRLAAPDRQWGEGSPGGDLTLSVHLIKATRTWWTDSGPSAPSPPRPSGRRADG